MLDATSFYCGFYVFGILLIHWYLFSILYWHHGGICIMEWAVHGMLFLQPIWKCLPNSPIFAFCIYHIFEWLLEWLAVFNFRHFFYCLQWREPKQKISHLTIFCLASWQSITTCTECTDNGIEIRTEHLSCPSLTLYLSVHACHPCIKFKNSNTWR